MPNIKSAKKRVLVNQTKARQNKILKTNLKTVIKNANNAKIFDHSLRVKSPLKAVAAIVLDHRR